MALLHRSKTLLAFVLLALLVTVAPGGIEAQESSEFQLSLSKSADVSNDSVEITIASDRPLREAPKVYVTRVIDGDGTAPVFTTDEQGETVPIDRPRDPVTYTGPYTYSYIHSGPESGVFSVYVEAEDYLGSRITVGSPLSSTDATAFTFELDTALNGGGDPTARVADKTAAIGDADVPEVEAFYPMILTVDYSRESGEYPGDSYRTVTLTSAELKVTFADGTSDKRVLDQRTEVSTPDNIQFTIALLRPKVGSYALTLRVSDAAGNTSGTDGHVFRWNVVPIKPVIIDLAPGWNLISLPFRPGNPAINSVVPARNPADIVMTYDNATRVWEVSRRDAETGLFTGDIIVMLANEAYFVRTDSFQGLSLQRPLLGYSASSPPPPLIITVFEGWNLVPVVTSQFPTPTTIPADNYFDTRGDFRTPGDYGWLKALTFNTLAQTWESVAPGETVSDGDDEDTEPDMAMLTVGKGYWVYISQAGTIQPHR